MPIITAQEWELLSFFAVEPELQDDAPWAYNDALYTVRQGDLTLTFAIAPAYCDVRIILSDGDTRIYELSAKGVHDVRYAVESGCETLHIVIDNRDSISMSLRLKPHIIIEQGVSRY
jgi:hypothetical protein